MTHPELFDIVELSVDLPEYNLGAGSRGAIVECWSDRTCEVEFANSDGETLALCSLCVSQFRIVWKAKTKRWVSTGKKLAPGASRFSKYTCRGEAFAHEASGFAINIYSLSSTAMPAGLYASPLQKWNAR